jgi:hypothetical protein
MAKIANKRMDLEAQTVTIEFTDGRFVEIPLAALTPEIVLHSALHGLWQKLGDSYAGAKGDVELAYAQCRTVADQLLDGNWNSPTRIGDGGQVFRDLVEVLVELAKARGEEISREEIKGLLKDLDKKQLAEIKKDPQVAHGLAEKDLARKRKALEAKGEVDEKVEGLFGKLFGG